ncbi:type 1 glutamine amidotransferase domain-containing protein [Nocardia sp. alder85J]|uniref:type 1 glutamine amidotransferase domain-containing protein n=1 Tax=Nocardia sp. alder85J TaxID=2862949 RepID=UPI001CD505F0|nr:type 1 glutamine amidotransferase domain-containing protein [Nocardia sp. alder85J]MCX4092281.1 type 1 glutamine amidotransferase domain-containing protein [Nocardia sp. alder85J]
MPHRSRALFIVTNTERVSGMSNPTGFDIREAAHVWSALRDHDHEISFASVAGGSVEGVLKGELLPPIRSFVGNFEGHGVVPTVTVRSQVGRRHDLLYFVGGLGCLWDFPRQPDIHALIRDALRRGTRIAAICHGPAAFVGLAESPGRPFVAGRRLTAFSDAEEAARGVLDTLPFSLERQLLADGAEVCVGPDGGSNVIVDGPLVTAQNPSSLPELCAVVTAPAPLERTVL